MRRVIILLALMILATGLLRAQPQRLGAGLTFSTPTRFNGGKTGNPGLNLKTWVQLDKRNTLFLVPSVSVFNPLEKNKTSHIITTYLLHGDLDVHYNFFHDKTVKVIALAGVNYSHIISRNELLFTPPEPVTDEEHFAVGGNLGAGLEMRMGPLWDFHVTGKYVFSDIKAFVIQVHAVYYFHSRGKGYRR